MKQTFDRRSLLGCLASLPLAGLAGGCSRAGLVNALVPRDGYRRLVCLPYGAGPRRTLDLYRPDGEGPFPVVVFFYGGGWDSGDRGDYLFVGQRLADAGYLVVIPDYRLYPEVAFPDFLDDCALAVAWAGDHAAEYDGDAGRLVLMGHSAGAYNAMMLALDTRYLDAAGWPASRIDAVVSLAGPFDFRPFDTARLQGVFGTWPESAATQPVSFARGDAPPLLLLTGTDDEIVLPRNSENLAWAIGGQGGAVTIVRYEGMGHIGIVAALAQPLPGSDAVFEGIRDFLDGEGLAAA